jgi:hypothetical protein
VPLVEYHGGGEAATLEPLSEHLDAYEGHLAQNLGAGVQACYRGPRLYDTEETKAVVKRWVDFSRSTAPSWSPMSSTCAAPTPATWTAFST